MPLGSWSPKRSLVGTGLYERKLNCCTRERRSTCVFVLFAFLFWGCEVAQYLCLLFFPQKITSLKSNLILRLLCLKVSASFRGSALTNHGDLSEKKKPMLKKKHCP